MYRDIIIVMDLNSQNKFTPHVELTCLKNVISGSSLQKIEKGLFFQPFLIKIQDVFHFKNF
jgi:hypothetical protein